MKRIHRRIRFASSRRSSILAIDWKSLRFTLAWLAFITAAAFLTAWMQGRQP